jgi:protein SCO1
MRLLFGSWLAACSGDVYIVEGVVVEVHPPLEVVVDHEPVAGLMDAMIMPFDVADPAMLEGVAPGDRITARYALGGQRGKLVKLRVTGHGPAPQVSAAPLRVGDVLPAVELAAHDGTTVVLGGPQADRVALTFIFTRCPRPDFCPALVTRLQALAAALGDGPPIVAVTIDPEHDTLPVLAAYAEKVGTGPRIRFARAPDGALDDLAMRGGLPIVRPPSGSSAPADIQHGLRLLVLDAGGKLLERYDGANFPIDRVVQQLRTGAPTGDPSMSGTPAP